MGILGLALRYLRTRRVALVAIVSIAVGVMAMIVVVALMDGVQEFIKDHFKGTHADVRVTHLDPDKLPDHWLLVSELLNPELEKNGGPIRALSPRTQVPALVVPGREPGPDAAERLEGLSLLGIDYALEKDVTPFHELFDQVDDPELRVPQHLRGDPLASRDGLPGIVIGDSLAKALGITPDPDGLYGGCVTVLPVPARLEKKPGEKERDISCTYRVTGCFSTGRSDYDKLFAYVDRETLTRIRYGDAQGPRADSIHLRLVDASASSDVAVSLSTRYPNLLFRSWERDNWNELGAIADQKRIMVVILSFIIAVAAVAILGMVYMMVAEKMRDIGILRSMGLSRTRMVLVFTVYGLCLGVIGSLAGLFLGLQLTRHLDAVVGWLSDVTGVQLLNAEIYRFKTIPVHLETGSLVAILLTALGMSFLAAFIPALKAGLLTPVRCLRAE